MHYYIFIAAFSFFDLLFCFCPKYRLLCRANVKRFYKRKCNFVLLHKQYDIATIFYVDFQLIQKDIQQIAAFHFAKSTSLNTNTG